MTEIAPCVGEPECNVCALPLVPLDLAVDGLWQPALIYVPSDDLGRPVDP